MSGYLRLVSEPTLIIHAPDCNACEVEVEVDPDGFICPSCGTHWSHDSGETEEGTLPDDEERSGLLCPNKIAWQVSHLDGEERDAKIKHILDLQEQSRKHLTEKQKPGVR